MKINEYSEKYSAITRRLLEKFAAAGGNENIILSPFSIVMLLLILADAAGGKTKEELLEVLGKEYPYEELRSMLCAMQKVFIRGKRLTSANAVCVRDEIMSSIEPGYEERLSELGGRLFETKDILRDVNTWVKEHTRGMITEIADESMNDKLACLMNAIAFEAKWDKSYREYDIYDGEFTNADGSVSEVQMMDSTENRYIENDLFTGLIRPYKGNDYAFMALLPKEEGPKYLCNALEEIDFTGIFKKAENREINVTIPEFRYDFTRDLTALCKEMGIETMFTPKADFSPMSREWLMIDTILHKAHIEVDRKGTKAAAVTASLMVGCAMMMEVKRVCLDRPFIYAIMHQETGLPVFAGVMNHVE